MLDVFEILNELDIFEILSVLDVFEIFYFVEFVEFDIVVFIVTVLLIGTLVGGMYLLKVNFEVH